MNNTEDVDYTFNERLKFLSPKPDIMIDKLGGIDETAIETIEPNDKLLSGIANRFSPKSSKRSIFDISGKRINRKTTPKRKSVKRRRSKNVKRRRSKSPKRRTRRRSKL